MTMLHEKSITFLYKLAYTQHVVLYDWNIVSIYDVAMIFIFQPDWDVAFTLYQNFLGISKSDLSLYSLI
jgi:hypothetical protein